MICPEFRWAFAGCDQADSLIVNPHKWLFTPMDTSVFYTRRPDVLRRAFALVREYLQAGESSRAVNMMDYGVPLGRRFRALKLWFIMRYYGREALAEMIRAHVAWAQELAAIIDADPDFERSAPTPFSAVCFRYRGTDEQNRALLEQVNGSGEVFLSQTTLCGKTVLHLAIGNMGTTRAHVLRAWELVKAGQRNEACQNEACQNKE
jgi:aromatic-L-amino-acid decarboxylase